MTVRRVKYTVIARRGTQMQPQELDIGPTITNDVTDAYLGGQCLALAAALAERTYWPIVAQCWGATELISDLGPRNELGYVQAETLTVASSTLDPAEILRIHFQHAFALSPDGAVDVRGLTPLHQLHSSAEAVTAKPRCECPPTCACLAPCCTGGRGFFYATLTPDTARQLARDIVLPDGRTSRAVVAEQNHDAAGELADILLDKLGMGLDKRTRTVLPRPRTVPRPRTLPDRTGSRHI